MLSPLVILIIIAVGLLVAPYQISRLPTAKNKPKDDPSSHE